MSGKFSGNTFAECS
jgi:hypothetical protein